MTSTPFALIALLRIQEEVWRYLYIAGERPVAAAVLIGVGALLLALRHRRARERTGYVAGLSAVTR